MKNKGFKIFLVSLVFLAILICGLFYVKSSYAYTFGGGDTTIEVDKPGSAPFGEGGQGLNLAFGTIFNAIITVSEIAFVILFLVGGIMYLSSMGDEEVTKKAKKLMVDAVIGLVIVLAAWAIGTWVINQLKGVGGTGGGNQTITNGNGDDTGITPDEGAVEEESGDTELLSNESTE